MTCPPGSSALFAHQVAHRARPAGVPPCAESFPPRASQLDFQKWVDVGFDEHDAREITQDLLYGLSHPNANFASRMPGGTQFVTLMLEVANGILAGTPWNLTAFQERAETIFRTTYRGNATALKLEAWASLNRNLGDEFTPSSPPPGPPPPAQGIPAQAAADQGDDDTRRTVIIVLCTVLPVLVAGLVVALAVRSVCLGSIVLMRLESAAAVAATRRGRLGARVAVSVVRASPARCPRWCRSRWIARVGRSGGVRHPGAGASTTLLVTDIEK